MPHIHTEYGQVDHVITLYIVRTDMDEPRVMLHRHRKLAMYLPVGGHVELDESPWQTAAHELREESGYVLDDLTVLQPTVRIDKLTDVVVHPVPVVMNTHTYGDDAAHYHSDTAYALVAHGEPTLEIDEGETQQLEWLSLAELSDLTDKDIYRNTKEIYMFILSELLHNWVEVPTSVFSIDNPT